MWSPTQLYKLQMQPQEVFSSDLYIYKATCFNFGLDPINITMVVSSDIDPDTLYLNNQTRDVTLLSCDLECDIIIRMPWKIFISANWAPDLLNSEHIIHSYKGIKDRINELLLFINTTHMI